MQPQKVWAVYFSGTGTTEKTVRRIASSLAAAFSAPLEAVDFTAPAVRKEALTFGPDDLVVLGTPTYAGRVPNVLLPYLTEQIRGAATPAVPVVLFGNRDFDDSLMELRNIMTANGFVPVAAAAFVGEHSFSRTLGAGRPNAADLAVAVAGQEPIRPYYTPRDRHGAPINILKVKPKTDMALCGGCGLCAARCPMGGIDPADVSQVKGICIKCCA